MSVHVTAEDAKALRDRESGIALLAEALSQDHFGGRYRELLRVFEDAFAESDNKLVVMLAEFLARRPRLGYTKTEVKRWMTGRRGRAVHADRSAPLVGADLGDVVDRMLLAAYKVLFNKTTWHRYDAARRDAWTPVEGPLDASGGWFVRQHETPLMKAQFYDPYGVYPLNLAAHGPRLGDDNFWPSSGPLRTTVNQGQVSVIPAAELTIISGD